MHSPYSFTTSALDGGEWSASRPGRALPPGELITGTNWIGGWVGPRAGLDTEDRGKILLPLLGIEPPSPVRPPGTILTELLVPKLAPNYKLHILSPAKVRKVRYSLAELYVRYVYLNLFGWKCREVYETF
jgi:hypothetical protein